MGPQSDIPDEANFHDALAAELRSLRAAGRLPHTPDAETVQTSGHILLTTFTMQFQDADESPALALRRALDRVQSGEDRHTPT